MTYAAVPIATPSALLRGKTLVEARTALSELSARFLRLRPSELPDLSLADGLSGVALVHAELDRVFPGAGHGVRAERALLRAIDRLGSEHLDPGLFLGLAGLGWVATYLVDPAERGAHEGLFGPIDSALAAVLDDATWSERFDLVYGITGVGLYALERLPEPSAQAMLAKIVARLAQSARRRDVGVAWWTDPAWSSCDPTVVRPPHQDYALGVSHGAAGVISFLGRVVDADVDATTRRTARALLGDAVDGLLAQERDGFGVYATPGDVARAPARIAWCVGDLGIAAALLVAARGAGETAWRRAALRIGLRAALRAEADAGAVDAGLCHGAAGIAHVMHRLYRGTRDERFALAARRWFAAALAMRTPGRGFSGFRALDPDRDHQLAWQSPAGFLTGGAGIALALIAATTSREPTWDRLLLLS